MYKDLDDIIFEERHKAYGAYEFRKHYEFNLTKALVIGVLFILLLFFLPTSWIQPKKITAVDSESIIPIDLSEMRINYGDNTNGKGVEEPKEERSSPAPIVVKKEEKVTATENSKTIKEKAEKDISENTVPIPTRKKNTLPSSKTLAKNNNAASTSKDKKGNAIIKGNIKKENASGDGLGNAAIGSLLKGRGTKTGSQGDGSGKGNNGDPLGGDGNGNSLIGVDRKLIGFIPGTMGRGGAQPTHACKASGSISIAYTVDKAGKVVSAKRLSGISDPCVSTTAVNWVKQYVKAEPATGSSKGTYKIVF